MGLRRKRRSGRLFEVAGDHGCAHEPKVTRDQAQRAGVPWSPRGWLWHMREAGREEDELAHRVIREGRTGGDSNNRAQLLETPPARESARHRPGIKVSCRGVTASLTAVCPRGARTGWRCDVPDGLGCPKPRTWALMPYCVRGDSRGCRVPTQHHASLHF